MTKPRILTKDGFITESKALDLEIDVIPKLHGRQESDKFRQKLQSSVSHIRELVSRHLQIPQSDFTIVDPSAWIEGAFNICVGIDIKNDRHPHLPWGAVIRFPLPFNSGESFAPGTMDEKLRCEAATYIWIRQNCPNIPLPRLLGMGFPGSRSFTAVENETMLNRLQWYLRSMWDWLNGKETSPYSSHTRSILTGTGYLLLEWDMTYSSTEPYIQDFLGYHDHRMIYQKNSILDVDDAVFQLRALVGMRALLPLFWNLESRKGPFVLSLPDLHQSNIFVNDDWNLVSIIDLEFAPVVPIQMTHVPYWLADKTLDGLNGSELAIYKRHYDRFVDVLEQEEKTLVRNNSYSQLLRHEWDTGRFWYALALGSINVFPFIYQEHLEPKFFAEESVTDAQKEAFSRLWCEDVDAFIAKKLEDYEVYKDNVRAIFAAVKAETGDVGEEERREEKVGQEEKGDEVNQEEKVGWSSGEDKGGESSQEGNIEDASPAKREEETSPEEREEVETSIETQHNTEQGVRKSM
ncbi:hypothetical protein QM012_008296 [Aureobasidium pullulans]|uniref:Aminoglycoside phosphotransferase domain-containing protein n=1 Tax=Aureobasidium pullulans TaxID=5580 RepID=A0ABR0TJL6_AURPU